MCKHQSRSGPNRSHLRRRSRRELPECHLRPFFERHSFLNQVGSFFKTLSSVLKYLNLLKRNQPATHHLIERRQEILDLILGVHNLDDDRKIKREAHDLSRVEVTCMAEA